MRLGGLSALIGGLGEGENTKKSEDKDQYLQDIQNQINEKKKAKELEKLRDREEEILFDEKVRRDNEEL